MKKIKTVCTGAGYFSDFQYDAWQRIPEVEVTAFQTRTLNNVDRIQGKFGIKNHYTSYEEMLDKEQPDLIDIITPPETHLEMCRLAAERGIDIICQKPLAPTIEDSIEIAEIVKKAGIRFVVHENFRFQPWHREIKKLIESGTCGNRLHSLYFRSRMGDGWGEDAYLARQPYFRDYPRLLIYETGIHYIDTFRYHAGEGKKAFAYLRKLNPVIKGEDCGWMLLEFESGTLAQWDANRYNQIHLPNFRYTFGEYLVEGNEGSIRLYADGKIGIQRLGEEESQHQYEHRDINFGGDCCYIFQRHAIDCILSGKPFETGADHYLKNLAVQEAVYQSAERGSPEKISYFL